MVHLPSLLHWKRSNMKHLLTLLTDDKSVIEDITALIKLFPTWEMRLYDNVEIAWIDYWKREPDLSIIDLDYTGIKPDRDAANLIRSGHISPLMLFISQEAMSSLFAVFATELCAIDYVQKPINLDRNVFALSIAEGPRQELEASETSKV